jgi:hypothetical protein
MVSLIIYTVSENPRDVPDLFVCRRWETLAPVLILLDPNEPHLTAQTADELRANLPRGLWRMPPEPGDDPVILESRI